MVNNHLDGIYKSSRIVARSYQSNQIHIKAMYKIIDGAKIKNMEQPDLQEFYTNYNKMLDKMKRVLTAVGKQLNDQIPLKAIEKVVNDTKKAFAEGLESQANN